MHAVRIIHDVEQICYESHILALYELSKGPEMVPRTDRRIFDAMLPTQDYPWRFSSYPVGWNRVQIVSMDNHTYTVKTVTENWFVLGRNIFAFKSCQCGGQQMVTTGYTF